MMKESHFKWQLVSWNSLKKDIALWSHKPCVKNQIHLSMEY